MSTITDQLFKQNRELIEQYRQSIALPKDLESQAVQYAQQIIEQEKPRLLAKYNQLLEEFKVYYTSNKNWALQFLTQYKDNNNYKVRSNSYYSDNKFSFYSVLNFDIHRKDIDERMVQKFIIENFVHDNYNRLVQNYPTQSSDSNIPIYYQLLEKLANGRFSANYFALDDANYLSFYLYDFSDIMPEIVDKISQFLLPKNYIFAYFTWLKAEPQIQALYGDVELNINSFENHASLLSVPYGEGKLLEFNESGINSFNRDSTDDDDTTKILGGWRKTKLLEAIFNSGLMEPGSSQRNLLGVNLLDSKNNQSFENYIAQRHNCNDYNFNKYKFTVMSTSIVVNKENYDSNTYQAMITNPQNYNPDNFHYVHRYAKFKTKLEADIYIYNKNHRMAWRTIGINQPGYIKFLYSSHGIRVRSLEMIYRRVYGTIYTLNWQAMCSSGQIKIFNLRILQWLHSIYFSHGGQITNGDQFCLAVINYSQQLATVFDQIKDSASWLRFVLSKYNQDYNTLKRTAEQPLMGIGKK